MTRGDGPLPGRRLRLRGEGDDAAPPGRAGHADRRAGRHLGRRGAGPRARRGVPLQRPRRPGRPARARSPPSPTCSAGCPIFGICLGHQLLAAALGGTTYKLPFGHHGSNHPVRRLATGRVEITSQNHNYAVAAGSVPGAEVTHVNLNDGVVEGIRCRARPAFSVQYHPEAGPGPPRRPLPVRRVRGADGAGSDGAAEDAPPRRHRVDPGDRLGPDRDRPGLRVRLLGHPGLPGAGRGGLPGGPGQLQPGHDHDRPGDRRPHLRRAARRRRAGGHHRAGAARRPAARRSAARPPST